MSNIQEPLQFNSRKAAFWYLIKSSISGWWHLLMRFMFEPILFGFGILLLYSRLQPIVENSLAFDNFWAMLGDDMLVNPTAYIIFGVLFSLWIFSRLIRDLFGSNELRDINKTLERIEGKLDKLNQGGGQNGESKSDRL